MQTWWRHQVKTFSALLAICAGNSPVSGEFPTQRPVTRSFDVFFGLRLNKRLRKQWWGWWFETLSCPLWRHRNDSYNTSMKHRGHQVEGRAAQDCSNSSVLDITTTRRTTRTPAFWGYPPPPHDCPYYWVILDLKSKEEKVKVRNLKDLPKLPIFEFCSKLYTRHTCSCLIRCANIKWIRIIEDRERKRLCPQTDRRTDGQTDGQGETSIPPFQLRWSGGIMTSQWAQMRLKSPALRLFTQPFVPAQIKENIKAPRHWPLRGEFPAQRASKSENVPFDDVITNGTIAVFMGPKFVTQNIIKVHNQRVQWLQQYDKHFWVVRIGRTYKTKLVEKKIKRSRVMTEYMHSELFFISCSQHKETIRPGYWNLVLLPSVEHIFTTSDIYIYIYIYIHTYIYVYIYIYVTNIFSKSETQSNEGDAFAFLTDKRAHGSGLFVVYYHHGYY